MSDSLLFYFEQELRFIHEEAVRFAEHHPGAARSLGINQNSIDDPQIVQLIESVALLNGRLQQRLDDAFPELTDSLIQLLFPHYLRTTPSYTMLELIVADDVTAVHSVPAGTEFDIQGEQGEKLVFRSTEDVELLPLRIDDVSSVYAPFSHPAGVNRAQAIIEISFCAVDETIDLSSLSIERLKLHLKGETNSALRLYDVLLQGTEQICISVDGESTVLGRQMMKPVGFDLEQTLLPYQAASFGGFRLLTEFFMCTERFIGFHISLGNALRHITGSSFKLQIFVNELSVDVARNLSPQNFALFTTPLINLQSKVAEPLSIDFLKKDYQIVLDAGQQQSLELFSVDKVIDTTNSELVEIPQIYNEKYARANSGLRWQLRQNMREDGVLRSCLSVADLTHGSAQSSTRVWQLHTTVSNGESVNRVLVTSRVECRDSLVLPARLQLLRRPSLPVRINNAGSNVWVLLGHLHFNYHAILGADNPISTLKDMFTLYNRSQSARNQAFIESLIGLEQQQIVAPIRVSGKSCVTYGTKITALLDSQTSNVGITLFSNLLDHFFSYFAGYNSFTQLDICLEGQDGVYLSFPRRSGCKSLL